MKNKQNLEKELEIIKIFIDKKKITITALSKEIGYWPTYVSAIFAKSRPISKRFMISLVRGIFMMLKKEIEKAQKVVIDKEKTIEEFQNIIEKLELEFGV